MVLEKNLKNQEFCDSAHSFTSFHMNEQGTPHPNSKIGRPIIWRRKRRRPELDVSTFRYLKTFTRVYILR